MADERLTWRMCGPRPIAYTRSRTPGQLGSYPRMLWCAHGQDRTAYDLFALACLDCLSLETGAKSGPAKPDGYDSISWRTFESVPDPQRLILDRLNHSIIGRSRVLKE